MFSSSRFNLSFFFFYKYFHDINIVLPKKDEMIPKKEETKEYNEIMRQLKKFNPRFAEETVRKNSKAIPLDKTSAIKYLFIQNCINNMILYVFLVN